MEKCALTMYVSMRKKDIRQNLISKGMLPVRNSISGQQSAATPANGVILGPYFFDRNVTGIVYLRMLKEFVFPQLVVHFGNQYWEGHFRNLWWVQDGASPHRVINVRDRLNEVFGNNRVVGLGHDVEWPPRSPDLTPCDFFLWAILRVKFSLIHHRLSMTYGRK